MHIEKNTKERLLQEVKDLRQTILTLEASQKESKRAEEKLRQVHAKLSKSYQELEARFLRRTEQLTRVIQNLQEKIIEHQKTEEALRESEERYALAVEGANDGIWDRDLITGNIYFSPRWKVMLGYEDDEIVDSRDEWSGRIHPDDVEMVNQHLTEYFQGRVADYKIEYRMRHKDGSYRWIFARGACLRDNLGRPYRMAGSHTDITGSKNAQEQLRKNEELLRIILENLPVGVSVFDREGVLILENKAKRDIWGISTGKGRNLADYKGWFADSGKPIKTEEWPVYRACSQGISESRIIDIEGFEGARRSLILSATPLNINEEITAGICIAEDITERRTLEQKLLQAQKMESIGLLAGGIAHEFNNLLLAISGFAEELLDPSLKKTVMENNVSMILSASREAAELTRNLLAFGRQQVFNVMPVTINDIIADVRKLLVSLGSSVNVVTDLTNEIMTVMADSSQIKQVLVNIAINAKDAMPSGGELKIKAWKLVVDDPIAMKTYGVEKNGCYAAISISDTGTGMDPNTLSRIFDPFFTTKPFGKGSGLGLAIAYGIIKQHNGSITVDSAPGCGTTFTICLPQVTLEKYEEKVERPRSLNGTGTILIAEDEELVRVFLAKSLEKAGHRVIAVVDGKEAVQVFQQNRDSISLVISDMVMPEMTGREMCKEIKKIKPGIRILFISGYSADILKLNEDEDDADFITKPFTKKDLLEKVSEILNQNLTARL